MCTRRMVLYRCLHTPLPLVGRHVFLSSGVPALRPPILDNGGVVLGGGAGFSSMLESAVGPVRLLDPGPALSVEKALPSCSSLFHSTSLPVFPVSVAEGEAEVHRAVAEWNEQFFHYCFVARDCSVFKAVGFHRCCPEDKICEVNRSG